MKKVILTVLILANTLFSFAQNNEVEKSTNGIQTNILGLYVYREIKLNTLLALRTELGMNTSLHGGSNIQTWYKMTPTIKIEPRWYYNLKQRQSKRRDTEMNAANFFTIQTDYQPTWLTISNGDVVKENVISVTPLWGIRRNIGDYLNYEVGVGYRNNYYFNRKDVMDGENGKLHFHLRLGYRF